MDVNHDSSEPASATPREPMRKTQPAPPRRKPWYRPRNIVLGVLALFLVFIAWAGNWVYWALTVEPNPSTDYAAQLEQLARDAQPAGENGWDDIVRACDIFERLDEAFPAHERLPHHQGGFEFEAIYRADYEPLPSDFYGFENVTDEDVLQETLGALAWLESEGAWEALAEAGAKPNIIRPISARGAMLLEILLPEIATMRHMAKARAATLHLALERGDLNAAQRAAQDLITLSRAASNQAIIINALVGDAIRIVLYNYIQQEITLGRLTPDAADMLLDLLNDNPPPANIALHLDGERLMFLDTVQWFYSDDGDGDGTMLVGSFDPDITALGGLVAGNPGEPNRLANLLGIFMASRADMTAKADETFDEIIRLATSQQVDRWDQIDALTNGLHALGYRYMLLGLLVPAVGKAAMSHDIVLMEYDGTRILLAIELHRAAHSGPPASLDALAPEFLQAVPVDTATLKPFGYTLLEDDEHDRDYLLYSFGRDLTNNNGEPAPSGEPHEALTKDHAAGSDFVINAPVVTAPRAADAE